MTALKRLTCLSSAALIACLTACQTMPAPLNNPASDMACRITAPFDTKPFDSNFAADMDQLMAHMIQRGIAPGAVIEIAQNGETVFSQAYGLADQQDVRPMTPDSLFRIYSMTKPITTVAALQLVDAGHIELDAPISRYLSDFADITVTADEKGTVTRAPSRAPTIRDLMRHTTGLTYRTGAKTDPIAAIYAELGVPAGPGVADAPTNGMDPVVGNDAFIDRITQIPLKHDPGTTFTYGNSTDVLGAVVAKVSGQSLSRYMADNIFEPLGMTDTFFQVPDDRAEDFTSAYIVPPQAPSGSPIDYSVPIDELTAQTPVRLDPWRGGLYSNVPGFEFGGAGLVSDVDDYLAFTTALMTGSPALISPALWAEASRDQLPQEARAGAAFLGKRGFGLGFAVRDAKTSNDPVFPQCGLFWAGAASTYFWIDPATNTTGVFMTQVFESDVRSYFSEILTRIYAEDQ